MLSKRNKRLDTLSFSILNSREKTHLAFHILLFANLCNQRFLIIIKKANLKLKSRLAFIIKNKFSKAYDPHIKQSSPSDSLDCLINVFNSSGESVEFSGATTVLLFASCCLSFSALASAILSVVCS